MCRLNNKLSTGIQQLEKQCDFFHNLNIESLQQGFPHINPHVNETFSTTKHTIPKTMSIQAIFNN